MAAFVPILPMARPVGAAAATDVAIALGLLLILSEALTSTLIKTAPSSVVSAVAQAGYLIALGLATIGLARRAAQAPWIGIASCLAFGFVALAWASTAWSILPNETWRRALILTTTALAGLYLASFPARHLIKLVATTGLVLATASTALALAAPQIGIMQEIHPGAWSGLWLEKNRLAAVMAVAGLACAVMATLSPHWGRWALGVCACAVLVVLAKSATSLAALCLGLGVMALIGCIRRGPLLALIVFGVSTMALTVGLYVGLAHPEWIALALGREPTFTGRTEIWHAVHSRIEARPWLGYGYNVFWDLKANNAAWIAQELGYEARNAHNAWLELQLDLGLLGASAIAAFIGYGLIKAIATAPHRRLALLTAPLLVMGLAMSVTEAVFAPPASFLWLVTIASVLALQRDEGLNGANEPA
jgi:exopolysaccharide production protein ExoQ